MKGKSNKSNTDFTIDMKKYHRYLADFINSKETFKVVYDGSSISIKWNDKSWRFINYGGVNGNGYHLCKFVYNDVKDYISKNPDAIKPNISTYNIDLELQKANFNGLKAHLGKQIYCVDVNDCYWDTAYKMGFISKSTYLRGLKRKEWKTGRNASIGGLSKVVVETTFIDGIRSDISRVKPEVDLSPIRNAIVNKVHDAFLVILKQLNDNWLMYFTDCIYVPLEKITEVREYFSSIGYQTKVSTYNLDIVDEDKNIVYWHDYQKNKAKSFRFSERNLAINAIPNYSLFKRDEDEFREMANKLTENTDFLNTNA
jgi:hypothetical protein